MSKLAEIFAHKAEELAARKRVRSLADVRSEADDTAPCRGFRHALASSAHAVSLIAEVKKASPSEGLIRADFDPVEVARSYEEAGADCLSVLTDERYFQGSEAYLRACRRIVALPILRKDFTSDPYHIYEARAMGADAVLLIAAWLEPAQAEDFRELAESLGMDALVEVHTTDEADIAIKSGAKLVGVNNRDLTTFAVSLEATERIVPRLRSGVLAVSESGLSSAEDVGRARAAGARAVLIGTAFCSVPDVGGRVRQVMEWV